jgi:hypothetical protein
MALPPEAYHQLDASLIRPLGGPRFLLKVPRLAFLGVWVEPEVEVNVTIHRESVVLRSSGCRLGGSELVQRTRLDDRFEMAFTTVLTWQSAPGTAARIAGDLELAVLAEVVPPFTLLPRAGLEGACNAVLKGLTRWLLPLFMRKLAADYERWALDPEYRARRAPDEHQQQLHSGGGGAP